MTIDKKDFFAEQYKIQNEIEDIFGELGYKDVKVNYAPNQHLYVVFFSGNSIFIRPSNPLDAHDIWREKIKKAIEEVT